MRRYGCSEPTSSGGSSPGLSSTIAPQPESRSQVTMCSTDGACSTASSTVSRIGSRCRAQRVVRGDHDLGLRVLQPLRHGRRGEAGEERHLDRADVRARVRGHRNLGAHGQVDGDPVAGLDPESHEALREPRHVARAPRRSARAASRPRLRRRRRPGRASAPPNGGRSCGRWRRCCLGTTSSTRARASRRRRDPRVLRIRGRCPRSARARTTRGRPASAGRAPSSRRSRAPHQADDVRALERLLVRCPHDLRHGAAKSTERPRPETVLLDSE